MDIAKWCRDIIEGPGGMNDYEKYEMAIWNDSERVAAAAWVLRCLANPECKGSQEVLAAILTRREEARNE